MENKIWKIKVPTWRATKDVSIPEDIVEEIFRIEGYLSVQKKEVNTKLHPVNQRNEWKWKRVTEDKMIFNGLDEIKTYLMIGDKLLDKCIVDKTSLVQIENPLSNDHNYITKNPLPYLLENANKTKIKNGKVNIFTFGKIINGPTEEQQEDCIVCLIDNSDKNDFFLVRDIFLDLFKEDNFKSSNTQEKTFNPKSSIDIIFKNEKCAFVSLLHPRVAKNFKLSDTTCIGIINITKCSKFKIPENTVKVESEYPSVPRDFSFVINKFENVGNLLEVIKKSSTLIRDIDIFDIFYISDTEKSVGIRLSIQPTEKTLNENEIKEITDKIITNSEKAGAKLRGV